MRFKKQHIDELKNLEVDGRLTPDVVVREAKRASSPLHDLFDWDVKKAAEAHWIQRARMIIGQARVVVHMQTITIKCPIYVRDPGVESKQQGYVTTATLQADPELAIQSLIQEIDRITGSLRRARGLAVTIGQEEVFDDLLETVAGIRLVITDEVAA